MYLPKNKKETLQKTSKTLSLSAESKEEKSDHNAQHNDLIPTVEHASAELIIWVRFITSNLIPGRSQT